jgi:hypothetical protein
MLTRILVLRAYWRATLRERVRALSRNGWKNEILLEKNRRPQSEGIRLGSSSKEVILVMKTTRKMIAEKLGAYLGHEIALAALVEWAESTLLDGKFEPQHFDEVRDAVARMGVADVRAFGLTWEDCEHLLKQLGYSAQINIIAT